MKMALPDSGSNAVTAHAHLVAEMLGFTTRDHIRVVWGDTDIAPSSDSWAAGRTITLQGAAICSAADKLRKDLLQRAASLLKVDVAEASDSGRRHFIDGGSEEAHDVRGAGQSEQREHPADRAGRRRAVTEPTSNKGVGACFVEVEVDTWTGDWRFVRALYTHDTGLVVNPLAAEADMVGSLVESTQVATDPIPWDREFPGRGTTASAISRTGCRPSWTCRKQTQLYIDSLEPRWFYGIKGFSETSIGSVPGAIANAIYNACGVRIREHPITREKIMAGLKALKAQGRTRPHEEDIAIYRPDTVEEAIQILSLHGTERGVYAGGTDLLIRLEEPAEAGADLSGRHQEDQQPALHQGRRRTAACRSAR